MYIGLAAINRFTLYEHPVRSFALSSGHLQTAPANDETSISGFLTKFKRALKRARVKMAAMCKDV